MFLVSFLDVCLSVRVRFNEVNLSWFWQLRGVNVLQVRVGRYWVGGCSLLGHGGSGRDWHLRRGWPSPPLFCVLRNARWV